MVAGVDVHRDLGARAEAHQTAAAPHSADLAHDLAHIWQSFQILGGPHRSFEIIGRLSVDGDQPHRFVSRELVWVWHPGRRWKRADLAFERLGVELDGEFDERLIEAHDLALLANSAGLAKEKGRPVAEPPLPPTNASRHPRNRLKLISARRCRRPLRSAS